MAIKFDLSEIPSNTHITNATLELHTHSEYEDSVGVYTNKPKSLHLIKSEWDEYRVKWLDKPALGEKVSDNNNTSIDAWEEYNVTSAIKSFITGNTPNNGFYIKLQNENENVLKGIILHSSESEKIEYRPKLTIEYESQTYIDKEQVHFNLNLNEDYTITISDIQGREIKSFNCRSLKKFSNMISQMNKGLHIVTFKTNNKVFHRKFALLKKIKCNY